MVVSFVVPTKDSSRTLERCLRSLRDQRHAEVEVIVVDNGSGDATVEIATRLAHIVERFGPERSAQRNRGLALASGQVVCFIDSDMTLEPGVAGELAELFAGDATVGAAVLPERSIGRGFLARCRAFEKDLYLGDPDVEAARAFRADVLAAVGGFDETLTALEDWELADRVEAAGWEIGRVRSLVWHDDDKVVLRRQFRKKRYYGRWLPVYLATRPSTRSRRMARPAIARHVPALLRSPALATGLVVLKGVEGAGIALGAVEGRRALRRGAGVAS